MPATVPVSVVVPTIGRSGTLDRCLRSILACDPRPAEVVVVDQSGAGDVQATVAALGDGAVRVVSDPGRGIARATNAGLRSADSAIVMRTDDDCTVASDWVGIAWERLRDDDSILLTGMVKPGGDPAMTPSTIEDPDPVVHHPSQPVFRLYSGNMAVARDRALALGGFDERPGLLVAAEDNDFCWRWMRAGGFVHYEPALVVWHHDWRDATQLRSRYRAYARGQGALYGKHLYARDDQIRGQLAYDVRRAYLAWRRAARRPKLLRAPDEDRSLFPHLLLGLVSGWREARRRGDPRRTT